MKSQKLEYILTLFFYLPQNVQHRKYARWKAAYIHNCLKNGETPQPGPIGMDEEDYGMYIAISNKVTLTGWMG